MDSPDGYTLQKCLHASKRSRVDLATRDHDGRPLLLKSYLDTDVALANARAERELDSLRKAAGPGVPAALELVPCEGRSVLAMERASGGSLRQWASDGRLGVDDALDVALQIVDVLSRVHAARLVHREVEPGNIVVDSSTRRAHLIDFDAAWPIGTSQKGEAARLAGHTLAGGLAFTAPEATGRMSRGIDERSDLYSLGATLYFALTGQPPFSGDDALALIHAHMALVPRPPLELRRDLPGTLSRIVLKLLQKEPEDRYQTAKGLRRDLEECRQQLRSTGRIADDLALGSGDPPPRPLFTRKLYGREAELDALLAAYEAAREGRPQLVLLSGSAGSGKSALAHELRRPVARSGGYLALGKFDLYRRDVPHSGWIALLGAFADQLLVESQERLTAWRTELRAALHNIAGALLELVPDLAAILGEVAPAPRLAPKETQARLSLAVQRFIAGAATREHPIVLVLDDLQWSDAASCRLLEAIVSEGLATHLLVVAAYRDGEVEPSHPFAALLARLGSAALEVRRIEMASLGADATARMLGDALGRSSAETRGLAACVMRKTGSIPLLVQQFVLHMHALGRIRFVEPEGWSWNDEEIAAAEIPEGAVPFMVAKLQRLAPELREVLEFASCMADEFDAALLSQLSGRSREALETPLFELAQQGLLAPSPRGFHFVHDRIREAAQALLSADARARLHWDTARHLLAALDPDERKVRVFEIADHLNRAGAHLPADRRLDAIECNRAAGMRSLATGAGATAMSYLAAARRHLRDEDWSERWPLCFELHLHSSESAFQAGDLRSALELLDPIDRPELSRVELGQVAVKRIQVFAISDTAESIPYTLGALARTGVRWPLHPSILRQLMAIASVEWKLWRRRSQIAHGLSPDPAPELRRAAIEIIEASGAMMLRADIGLFVVSVSYSVARQLTHGYVSSAAFSLGGYAAGISLNLMSSRRAAQLGDIALSWAASAIHPLYSHRVDLIVHGLIRPFVMSRRTTLQTLGTTVERMLEMGDPEFAYYALTNRVMLGILGGDPLVPAQTDLRNIEPIRRRIGYRYAEPHSFLRAVELLCVPDVSTIDWDEIAAEADAWFVAQKGCNEPQVRTMWVLLFSALGRYDLAFAQSEQIWKELFKSHVLVHIVDHTFLRGLAAAVLAEGTRGRTRRRYQREIRGCLRRLRRWARDGPDFLHMVRTLEAERARLRGRPAVGLQLYRGAALRATQQGFGHHAAILQERQASLLLAMNNRGEAAACLGQAASGFRAWGALGRAVELQAECATMLAGPATR